MSRRKEGEPTQYLYRDTQFWLGNGKFERYVEAAWVPQNWHGLQEMGFLTLEYDPLRSGLTINKLELLRGDMVIDLLPDAEFTQMRRETRLDSYMLDGDITVLLPVKGAEIGDIIRIGYTNHYPLEAHFGHVDMLESMNADVEVNRLSVTVNVAKGEDFAWRGARQVPKPRITETDEATRYVFRRTNAAPYSFSNDMPEIERQPWIQFTDFASWAEVAESVTPTYDAAANVPEGSDLERKIVEIRALHRRKEDRMMAALRAVQEDMRYIAILLGTGAYAPTPASEAWDAREGDCKGKSTVLLAMLREMGIEAVPLLVSTRQDGGAPADWHPSMRAFDHVIVRAKIGKNYYYLDGTGYGDRALDDVQGTAFAYGLPIQLDSDLVSNDGYVPELPSFESEIVWDASAGFGDEVPFTATLTVRRSSARQVRAALQSKGNKTEIAEYLRGRMPRIPNDDLAIVSHGDGPDGSYVVRFEGHSDLGWEWDEGRKFDFAHNALRWHPSFLYRDGSYNDIDVYLGDHYWQREKETVRLPENADIELVGEEIASKMGGVEWQRLIERAKDEVVVTSDYKRFTRRITGDEAEAAIDEIVRINDALLYLVDKSAKDEAEELTPLDPQQKGKSETLKEPTSPGAESSPES